MDLVRVEPKSFVEINREERFFCALLTHALLSSEDFRIEFFAAVASASGVELDPAPDRTEIYSEVAWMRDHWRNLGDPKKWTTQLRDARTEFLANCLRALGKSIADVESRSFFTTKAKVPKVVSPGRWGLADLAGDKDLQLLKWAFNAKPDFLLVCSNRAVIIEAKVESGPGSSVSGYTQEAVQDKLQMLIPAVTPYLTAGVGRMWLAPKAMSKSPVGTVRWDQVAEMVSNLRPGSLDDFTHRGLERFARRVGEAE